MGEVITRAPFERAGRFGFGRLILQRLKGAEALDNGQTWASVIVDSD